MSDRTTEEGPSDPTKPHDSERAVTVANIQRLESGYFDHMQSLRDRVPVANYLVEQETGQYSLIAMVLITVGLLVLFPLTMFYQYTFLVVLLYLIAFVILGKLFYDRVMIPNEETESWRD